MIAMLPVWSSVCCLAAEHEVGVYLRTDGGVSQSVLSSLKTEMDTVLNQAGFRLKWWTRKSPGPIEAEDLIVVDLRGSCDVPQKLTIHQRSLLPMELASTSTVGSDVLPFSSLDCSTFNELMNAPLWRADKDYREFLYGRALGRVLSHEFYHVLVRTHKHTSKGVAKKAHSATDLLSSTFTFDEIALQNLRQSRSSNASDVAKKQTGSEGPPVEVPAEPVVAADTPSVRQ